MFSMQGNVPLMLYEMSVLYMQTSAEFIANNLQVYENAAKAIDLALSDKSWSAAIEQNGDFSKKLPAIIIDVDETVLDNSPYQARAIKDNGKKINCSVSLEEFCNAQLGTVCSVSFILFLKLPSFGNPPTQLAGWRRAKLQLFVC